MYLPFVVFYLQSSVIVVLIFHPILEFADVIFPSSAHVEPAPQSVDHEPGLVMTRPQLTQFQAEYEQQQQFQIQPKRNRTEPEETV